MMIGSKDSAMPGGPSFKFNPDHIWDFATGAGVRGGRPGGVKHKSDVSSVRI